ncbi:hypothetical protein [Stygiolobus caldivivus]|uniref:Uncharacterized protein n=1 Tax=Stygiolobus caldivivus TaxID=2824673 RepID=A0A8D5ZHV5_9CREN|nr:hypothetical protein [Stygiolobus caldivivus]BCU68747.1 hypothetical protein KN1_00440 [Stygiolobus caldivivus]
MTEQILELGSEIELVVLDAGFYSVDVINNFSTSLPVENIAILMENML